MELFTGKLAQLWRKIQRFTRSQVYGSSPQGGGLINRLLKIQLCK